MNKFRFSALVLALTMSAVSVFSCTDKTPSNPEQSVSIVSPDSPQQVPNKYSGDSKKTNSAFGQEIEVNNTVFTLNDVVSISDIQNLEGSDIVFINVTIKNNTDIEYEISSLNNFFIALPDDTEILTNIRAKLYALNNYPKCVDDYITIPANGEFTGFLAGGFVVPAGTDSLTVGFFPTLDDDRDTSNVILSPVSAENITHDDSVLK